MEILKIVVGLSFEILSNVREKGEIIVLPLACNDCNGGEKQFYMSIFLDKVNPLGKNGSSFFKGRTVPINGEESIFIDGAVSVEPKGSDSHNYGYLAIYD